MPSWERIGFAILRGGVKGIPLVGGVIEEVLRCFDEERIATAEEATASLEPIAKSLGLPERDPDAATLDELEGLATRAWTQLTNEEQWAFRNDARSLAAEDDPKERREAARRLARDLTAGLVQTGLLKSGIGSAVTGCFGVPALSSSLVPGTLIENRYRLEHVLSAAGGMGVVWVAHDRKFNKRRAVKIAGAAGTAHAAFKARFQREAQLGDLLGAQTGIVRAFDWGELPDGVRLFLVMDLVENAKTLDLRTGTIQERLRRFEQACARVAQIHAKGVVHRDLKPANFLQAPNGIIWLTDFGIAKRVGYLEAATGSRARVTAPGEAWGTPPYMPPEQFANFETVDARADVFALGVMLFELTTGGLPYPGPDVRRGHFDVESGKVAVPTVRSRAPAVTSGIDALCSAALSLDPAGRPATAGLLVTRLRTILRTPTRRSASERPALGRAVEKPGQVSGKSASAVRQREAAGRATQAEAARKAEAGTAPSPLRRSDVVFETAEEFQVEEQRLQIGQRWDDLVRLYEIHAEAAADDSLRERMFYRAGEVSLDQLLRVDQAEAYFQRAFDVRRTYLPALGALKALYAEQKSKVGLKRVLSMEVEVTREPRSLARLHHELGRMLREEGKHDEAIVALLAAINANPKSLAPLKEFEELATKHERWRPLVQGYRALAASSRAKEAVILHFLAGKALEGTPMSFDEASRSFTAALEAGPKTPRSIRHDSERRTEWLACVRALLDDIGIVTSYDDDDKSEQLIAFAARLRG